MPRTRMAILVTALIVISLVSYSPVFSAPDTPPNICNVGEFWEGLCLSRVDWEAGWYLHPDNDPGDGLAVAIAYSNYEAVIFRMPHQMCVDWRSANCDGNIPPDPPVHKDEKKPRNVPRSRAGSAGDCIVQAHFQTSISSYCQRLIRYDATLTEGDAGFNAETLAARRKFLAGLPTRRHCARSAAYIVTNSDDYTAGNLQEPQVVQIEADIVAVHSWSCAIYHNQTPPPIPDSPSS